MAIETKILVSERLIASLLARTGLVDQLAALSGAVQDAVSIILAELRVSHSQKVNIFEASKFNSAFSQVFNHKGRVDRFDNYFAPIHHHYNHHIDIELPLLPSLSRLL